MKTFYKLSAVLVMLCALSLTIVTSALADTSGYAPTFFNSNYAKTHEINSLETNNTVTLKWVDPMGNTVRSETLAPGQSADPIGINASLYDTETMMATVVTGWYWDLDGEGDLYTEEPISSYTADDAEKVGGSEITVYPKSDTRDLSEGMAYIAYYTDSEVTRLADESTERFADVNELRNSFPVFPDGTVLKFVSTDEVIYLRTNTSYSIDGKALTVDLNGKTLSRVMSAAYSSGVFRVGEGGAIEITSSIPGARVFLAGNRSKPTENIMYGTDGLVEVKAKVDSANVRLSNFEFNGGTMFKASGDHNTDSMPEYANDIPITVDVTNIVVNSPLRSSYSVFSSLAPDVVINVTDSKFYIPHGTYAVFHDYANVPAENKYYQSETDVTMKGCEILCVTEAETPKMAKIWFSMGANSSFYVEDSKIIAKLADSKNAIKGSFIFGAGVTVATDKFDYFDNSHVGYAENVNTMFNRDGLEYDLTLEYVRSGLIGDYSLYDSTNYKLADTCFTDIATITRSYPVSFVSFIEDELPDFIGSITWLDDDGLPVVDQFYSFVGLPLTVPATMKELGCYDSYTDWYTRTYSWANYDGTPVPETVTHGINVYAPLLTETVHINNKKASMTLGAAEVFNLYLPIPDKNVKEGSVASADAIGKTAVEVTVGGFRMLRLSFPMDIEDFESRTVTITFSPRSGKDISYDVEIGTIAYAETIINSSECGSNDAKLACELVSFKKALTGYLGTLLSDGDEEASLSFATALASHGNTCRCSEGFEGVTPEKRPASLYSSAGIKSLSYVISDGTADLKIDILEGTSVKSVSYITRDGKAVTHDSSKGSLKRVEGDTGAYYTVEGISVNDAMASTKITVYNGFSDTEIEYSLIQYIAKAEGGEGSNSSVLDAIRSFAAALGAIKS